MTARRKKTTRKQSDAAEKRAAPKGVSDLFTVEFSKDELRDRIASGKYSLLDALLTKALGGNERVLLELLRAETLRSMDFDAASEKIAREEWERRKRE